MFSVLLIEDDPIIASDLTHQLELAGYTVCHANNSANALELAVDCRPRLALVDIDLGDGADGVSTASQLRGMYAGLPIVYLTGNSDERNFERARATEPKGFLTKPFRSRDLLHTLSLALDRSAPGQAPEGGAPATAPHPEATPPAYVDRIFVPDREKMVRILLKDVLYLIADGYYCRIVTTDGETTLTTTLKNFMTTLPANCAIMRIHRSYAVNVDRITEVGTLHVAVEEHRIPMSRNKRDDLMAVLK